MLFATMRTVGLLGVGYTFVRAGLSGVLGSTIGFSSAALAIAIIAAWMVRRTATATATATATVLAGRRYLAVLAPLALAQFFTNALMQLDIMLLGRFLAEAAHTTGLAGDAAEKAADEWVGAYRACQLFAFLPYQLLLSLTQVLFPMLARAKVESPTEIRAFVLRGARLGAIATGLLVAVIAGMPESAIRFAYNADIASRGAHALRVLVLAQGGFAMLGIGCTVLSSLGRERISALLTAAATFVAATSCALVVPHHAFGADQLMGTASCMAGTLAIALLACGILVTRVAGAFVPWSTALRVAVALALTVLAGTMIPAVSRVLTPLLGLGLGALFLLLLIAMRELRMADAGWAFRAVARRPKTAQSVP
jgi:stage V sporulation protein B